jgi:hypothetical protein
MLGENRVQCLISKGVGSMMSARCSSNELKRAKVVDDLIGRQKLTQNAATFWCPGQNGTPYT